MLHVTLIDFSKSINDVQNLKDLPKRVRDEIKAVERIDSLGFQELCGYNGRQLIFSAGGHWDEDKFVVTSYGSHNYCWDGERLTNAVKVYV